MKAVLFCRVSSKEQEEEGYSLPAQEKFLREYAGREGFAVEKVYSVSESASGRVQRKIFNEMIDYIRKHSINVVIVETTDRLTRNFVDSTTIDKWVLEDEERQIHLAKESSVLHKNAKSHEWFMWRVKVASAEYYVRQLSENVKKGQKEKLAQGWLPTKPPLGYKTIGEERHRIHVIDEKTGPFVRRAFELYGTGNYSVKKLAKIMYDEGLRKENGNRVATSRLHRYLSDPFYCGKNRWNDKITNGRHDPLISEELFSRVQELLRSKTTPKYRKHFYLFKGLIRCAECSGLVTWETHKGITYGHCNHYRNCSQRVWSKEPEVEDQLLDMFDLLVIKNTRIVEWVRKALKESHQDKIEYHSASLDELNRQHALIEHRLEKLYEDKIDEVITKEFYERKFKQYSEEKEQIAETIKKHANASTKYYELGINIYELSQRAKAIYLKAKTKGDQEKQRQLLKLVLGKISLNEGKVVFEFSSTFQLLVEAVRATNRSKVTKTAQTPNKIFEPSKTADLQVRQASSKSKIDPWLPG